MLLLHTLQRTRTFDTSASNTCFLEFARKMNSKSVSHHAVVYCRNIILSKMRILPTTTAPVVPIKLPGHELLLILAQNSCIIVFACELS